MLHPSHASNRISALEDISVFTDAEEVPLKDVFVKIFKKEDGKQTESPKKMSGESLKAYFEEIVPDYDREKVYISDMKKALQWYNLLISNNMLALEDDGAEEEVKEESKEEKEEESAESN